DSGASWLAGLACFGFAARGRPLLQPIDERKMATSRPETRSGPMSQVGQTRKSSCPTPTSGLPLKADIRRAGWHVRKVPCVDGSELARAFFTFCSIGRRSHVFGLLMRLT